MSASAHRVASRWLLASREMYRGMVVKVRGGSQIRKLLRDADKAWGKYLLTPGAPKPSDEPRKEATRLLEQALKGEVGVHWTTNRDIAKEFAKARQATGRGNTFHLVLTADLSAEGYDPVETGEELIGNFGYIGGPSESEVRLPPGTPVRVRAITIYGGKTGPVTVTPAGSFRA